MSAQTLLGLLHEGILSCDSCASSMSISEPKSLPKCLDCSHSFCSHCLEKMKVGMGIFSTIICPTCNVETTVGISGVEGLNTNKTILQLLHIIGKFNELTASTAVTVSPSIVPFTDSPPALSSLNLSSPTTLHLPDNDENVTEAVVTCPRNEVGKVIGIGGCTIKSIRQEADCVVEVKRVSDKTSPARILMRGTPEKVHKARLMVESALYPDAVSGEAEMEQLPIVLTLPLSQHEASVLFELNYSAIENIIVTTGAEVKLDKTPKAQRVVIVGKPSQAHAAKAAISSIIMRDDDADESPPLVDLMETIVLQPEHYHKLVTTGAGLVSRIAYRTGCDMEVTASDGNDSSDAGMMIFRGTRMQIDEAKQLFYHIFDNRPISFTQGMNAVGYHPGSISALQSVGSGKFIRRANTFTGQSTTPEPEVESKSTIAHNFTPNITLQRDNSNSSDRLPYSKDAVVRLPCDEESLVRLIGPHGSRLSELQELTQCAITVSRNRSNQQSFVEIRGPPERVNSAAPVVKMVLGSGSAAIAKLRSGIAYSRGVSMDMTTDERSFSMEDDGHINDSVSVDSGHRYEKDEFPESGARRRHSLRSNSSFSSNTVRETSRDNCDVIETKHPLSMTQVRELMNITGCCISINTDTHNSRVCVWGTERQKEYCAILVNTLIGLLAWYQPINWADIKTLEVEWPDIGASKVKEIEVSSNTHIIVDKSSATCRIYGASSGVDTAVQLLERHVFVSHYGASPLRRMNSSASESTTPSPLPLDAESPAVMLRETMKCPSHKIAQVIGKKGSIIKEVKNRSGCDMQVETKTAADGSSYGIVQLSGSAEQLRVAKDLLGFIMNVGPAEALGMEVCNVNCPMDKVPLVIGAKGATSREMMRRSGCKIHVNEANTFHVNDKMCCSIELTGTKAQIADAKELLDSVMQYGTKALGKRFKKTTQSC